MARWHSCNILRSGADGRHLWQFQLGGENLKLTHQETKLPAEPLTTRLIAKDWQTLYQKKLNVACLPSDKVFLRAIQIPAADYAEAQSMVELQLEKLSPIPVAQAVWSFALLPGQTGTLRTAVVVVAERDDIEKILGQLEGAGYLADRLEVPFLDQLLATKIEANGAWIYPVSDTGERACLVAWWYGGTLHNLALLHLPPEPEAGPYLRQQISQMAWAGEVEGWVTSPPRWHLVSEAEQAALWLPRLRLEDVPLETVAPVRPAELAALTAKRAASAPAQANLLPPEFAVRYRQTFIDRIWMRALGAVVMVVLAGTMVYLAALQVVKFQVGRIESEVARKSVDYNAAMKTKAEMQVLQDQVDLQYAALECWQAVATLLPDGLMLEGMTFAKGKSLSVFGTGPADASPRAMDYNEALSKAVSREQPLFSKVNPPRLNTVPVFRWDLSAELKRTATE